MWSGIRLASAITVVASLTIGCGKSPTSPGSNPGGSGSTSQCRTHLTAGTRTLTTTNGLTGTIVDACSPFNRTTNELTCTLTYSDSRGLAYVSTSVFRLASVGDFVGDAPRPYIFSTSLTRPASGTIVTSGVTNNSTYTYDSQGRLTRLTSQLSSGANEILNFSTWDSFGRPLGATATTTSFTYGYDDSARTATITNAQGGVITQFHDANGIMVRQVGTVSNVTETQVWTVSSTNQVCR